MSSSDFECVICFEEFSVCIPKTLTTCGHVLCLSCIQKLIVSKKIVCALCKQTTTLQTDNADELPTNYELKEKAETAAKDSKGKGKEAARESGSSALLDLLPRFSIFSTQQTKTKPTTTITTTPTPTAKKSARDYKLILPYGKQTCERVYGPKLLGEGFEDDSLGSPAFAKIIPKEWFLDNNNNNNNNNNNSSKEPFSSDDLLAISDRNKARIVLLEKKTGKVKSIIKTSGRADCPNYFEVQKASTHPHLIIIIASWSNTAITVFDVETGEYLKHFEKSGVTERPCGLVLNRKEDQIIIANNGSNLISIHKGFDQGKEFGETIRVIGLNFIGLYGVGINSSGNLIATSQNKFDIIDGKTDKLLKTVGKAARETRETDVCFNFPTGVFVDEFDNIFISDSSNHRVQIFNKEGEWINSFGKAGDNNACFGGIYGVSVHNSHDIYVVDWSGSRVMMF
eukprot:TRINITY_DN1146_c0_g1_i4.p1 TRINITY_DN1146_c0_g1~~TRINITY_DN1146_c0_g1_i4.p1  ORF type:complete len:454 (+),score=120.31 TRINITY_DN1146_c0_g1_i4:262-1623(+)